MRPRVLAALTVALLLAPVAAGCGDDDGGDQAARLPTTATSTPEVAPVEKDLRCSRGTVVKRGRSSGSEIAHVTGVVDGRAGSCLRLRTPSTQGAAVVYKVRCTQADGSKETSDGSSVGLAMTKVRSATDARNDERCRVTAKAYMWDQTVSSSVNCEGYGCDISANARQRATGRLEVAILKPGG